MKTAPLHDEIAAKRDRLNRLRAIVLNPDSDAREVHGARATIAEIERELESTCQDAHTGEAVHADLVRLIPKLMGCTFSRHLGLSITALENAEFRLRKHLGPNPH